MAQDCTANFDGHISEIDLSIQVRELCLRGSGRNVRRSKYRWGPRET
jgi:hypothetical protein